MKIQTFLIEVSIVLFGVLLAFVVENQTRKYFEKESEKEYINRLKADFYQNINFLQDIIVLDSLQVTKGVETMEAIKNNNFILDSLPSALMVISQSSKLPIRETTYKEMINVGDLSLITNDSLRLLMVEYFVEYEGVKFQEYSHENIMRQQGLPYVHSTFDILNIRNNKSQHNQNAISNIKFGNMIYMFTGITAFKKSQYDLLLNKNRKILEHLDSE